MIDDNWADYYGRFDFRKDRFSNAAAMVDTLHRLGFKVMLWISPFVSPDTEVFRELLDKKLLLMSNGGNTAITRDKALNPAIIPMVEWLQRRARFYQPRSPAMVYQQAKLYADNLSP
jgi:alpha-glucosidase (family GH31 glycosyl hydrolase)